MKRFVFAFFLAALVVGLMTGLPSSANASTSFSFSYSEGGAHRPHYTTYRHHDRGRHYGHYKQHRPVVRSFYYSAPPVIYAPPPVVYQPVRYVPASSLLAEPASPSYIDAYGQQCREYQSKSWIGGALRSTYGTACLQPDGAWRVMD